MAYTWQGNDGWWYTSNSGLQYGPYPDQGAASQQGAADSGDFRPAAPAPAPSTAAPTSQPTTAPGVGTAPPAGDGLTGADRSAKATLQGFMEQFGLPASLGEWAWNRYLELGEGSERQIMLELRQRPEYTARFPAMAALSAKGRAISEAEYVQYEKDAANIFSYAGLSQFATPAYISSLIAGENSIDELRDRIYNGYSRIVEAPPEVRAVFQEWFGPNSDAALAGWFLDAEHTEPFIKDAIETAQAGGYGRFFGFNIDQAYAKLIGDIAQTPQALVSGFQEAIAFKPLTFETISETTDLTEGETVAAAFGTGGSALEEFRKRLESRAAYSRGGGSALMTEEGLVGAGSAGQ